MGVFIKEKHMSEMRCGKCGGLTNSSVCDWNTKDGVIECYAKFENGKWIRGCGYDNCDPWTKPSINKLIKD